MNFVQNHPYRIWYLINHLWGDGGSAYVGYDNSVGLNLKRRNISPELVKFVLDWIKLNITPLEAVKSVRAHRLVCNVSSKDEKLIKCMRKLSKQQLQQTFLV